MSPSRDSALSLIGVDTRGEALYRAVLQRGTVETEQLARQLGWDEAEVRRRLRQLDEAGLLSRHDGEVSAVAPRLALGRVVDRAAVELRRTERRLEALRAAIPDFVAEEHSGSDDVAAARAVEVTTLAELVAVLDALIRSTTGEMLFLHSDDWLASPPSTSLDDLLATETAGGRACRSIYPLAALDRSEVKALLLRRGDAGEEVRLLAEPPGRLAVFGSDAGLMPTEWGAGPGPRVIVRTSGVVAVLRGLFEQLWDRAIPLAASLSVPPAPDSDRTAVLRLLAAGAKDEAIARRLGISLRTVRRRVSELIAELGVGTRFAAGAEAVRRGWL